MEEKTNCLVIKANLMNALLLDFLKHIWWNSAFAIFLGMVYYLVSLFLDLPFNMYTIFYLVAITLLLSVFMISKDLIRVTRTKYLFYARHMEYNYSFIKTETHSINYSQISDIEIKKNVWDRICGVGDLIIHTSNEDLSDDSESDYLRVKDIKNPENIKNQIMSRIHL